MVFMSIGSFNTMGCSTMASIGTMSMVVTITSTMTTPTMAFLNKPIQALKTLRKYKYLIARSLYSSLFQITTTTTTTTTSCLVLAPLPPLPLLLEQVFLVPALVSSQNPLSYTCANVFQFVLRVPLAGCLVWGASALVLLANKRLEHSVLVLTWPRKGDDAISVHQGILAVQCKFERSVN